MNESKFCAEVRSKMKGDQHCSWKTSDRFRPGIPDELHLGANGTSLWIEWKHDHKCPNHVDLLKYLSKNQQATLKDFHRLGQKTYIGYAVGTNQGVIVDFPLKVPILTKEYFEKHAKTKQELADQILLLLLEE
jgi:hypothetical protein